MNRSVFWPGILALLLAFPLSAAEMAFDFESGDIAAEGWRIYEGPELLPVTNNLNDFLFQGDGFNGQYFLSTFPSDHSHWLMDGMCQMESPIFTLQSGEIRLQIRDCRQVKTYVTLAVFNDDGSVEPVFKAQTDAFQEVVWDASDYVGKKVLFQLIDNVIGGWHIQADNFRFNGEIVPEAAAVRDQYLEKVRQEKAAARQERERLTVERRPETIAALPEKILYISRQQYRPDHHNSATLFQPGEINTGSFTGGGAMKVWFPQTDEVKTLLELPEGVVRDPTIDFDGQRVIFAFRKSIEDSYHLGELTFDFDRPTIRLEANTPTDNIDGFRQITSMEGVSDIDPIYLPDGRILCSSTREPKFCMCNRHIMGNLYVMNRDGTNIEQIGKSTLFEGHPSLLPDGRILYERWEYVDRNFGDAQGLWVANPDGTKHEIFWGNNTASPGGVLDARILPGSDSEFVAVFGSCHDRPWGAIALVDRRLGIDGKEPVIKTWPPEVREWVSDIPAYNPIQEAVQYDTFSALHQKFEDPFPLSDTEFLASGQTGNGEEMGIFVLTDDELMIPVHQDPASCYDPMPIEPTEKPMSIAERIDRTKSTGVFVVSNLYEGMGMENVEPGSIKYLRVVESPEKRFWTHTLWDWCGTGTQAPGMAWNDFNNKRILGTVPVEEDGSVKVEIPAERYVYFQVLDENKQMIQSMRSGIMVRPGETNACVGCHESRIDAPESANLSAKALSGDPKPLEPWFGPERLFSYRAEVQPVFDKYCLACHDFGGPASDKLILAGDRNMLFCESYYQLREKGYVRVVGAGPHNLLPAHTWGASQSRLGQVLLMGHPNPEIDQKRKEMGIWFDKTTDPESYERVTTWLDINAPYYPTYGSAYRNNQFGRSPLNDEQKSRLEALVGHGNLTFDVSFDRPELSRCLSQWNDDAARQSAEYQEALSIIQAGQANLANQDRGEDPNFAPVDPIEIRQQEKYDALKAREMTIRQAILEGRRFSDADFAAP